MGSMLAEALPFLRSIAVSIQKELGSGHPGVLPTTMVVYALTSILLGAVFLILAALRCGRLTGYFPPTVMTGIVGAVGVSLFLLGLEITLSSRSPHLSFGTLFERAHLPLLAASLGPAILLSLSTRLSCLDNLPKKPTKHPLYIPLFCCAVAGVFWIVVAACENTSTQRLASAGWLFAMEQGPAQATAAAEWDYWALFDFNKVEWRALSAGTRDILLLVLIGALSLPIFASAAALEWGEPDQSMNHEFVGHGISNTVAGAMGALPNLFVYSNSRFFHHAEGGRREAAFVALFTLAFFFVSFRVLPYVPTIQASVLVLFVGIELTLKALWESSASLSCWEWTVVASTTLACTFLGFASGTGVGLAIVVVLQFCHHVFDTRPQVTQPCKHVPIGEVPRLSLVFPLSTSIAKEMDCYATELPSSSSPARPEGLMLPPVVRFKGRVGSLVIPPLDQILARCDKAPYIILDLLQVDAIETSVAEYIQSRAGRILERHAPLLIIVVPRSRFAVMGDLKRGKVDHGPHPAISLGVGVPNPANEKQIQVYETLEDAIRHARNGALSRTCLSAAEQDACFAALSNTFLHQQTSNELGLSLAELRSAGLVIQNLKRGDAIACSEYPFQPSFVILDGRVTVRQLHAAPLPGARRKCIRKAVPAAVKACFRREARTEEKGPVPVTMEGSLCGVGPKVVAPRFLFCARVESEFCLIIDINSTHHQRRNEIVELDGQSGASKEME
ncbi:sulfate transporter [Pyrenophora tritici-repentis]|nr:sulfate transporter [Pyrenophora tritici-repentis]